MSGIAEVLLNLRYEVSGSDTRLTQVTARLARMGACIWEGHDAAHVHGAEAVVASSAVRPDNPEVVEANRLQLPVIPRGEMLAELMRLKFGIAVAGSHGKTTTTSMAASVLAAANLDPTMVVGGRLNSLGTNARLGKGEFMVVESDESDRSFLHLAPILAVVTSIDREHLDCYGSLEELCSAYTEFANKVPFYGASIVCLDDENVRSIVPLLRRRVVTYGTRAGADAAVLPQPDLIADQVVCGHFQSRFRLRHQERDCGLFSLRVPGRHNVMNAMAAIAVGLELKIDVETIRAALAEFGGVERRFETRGVVDGVTVVDDYGHHPTEIRATLAAARDCGYQRVLAVFQPHRYTRTAHLLDDFGPCFADADRVFVLDIYPAGEPPIEGISTTVLVDRMRSVTGRDFEYQPNSPGTDELLRSLVEIIRPGDLVLTLGAGNVWQWGDRLLELLKSRSQREEVRSRKQAALQ